MCEMSGCNQILTKRHAMHEHISGIFHETQPLTEDVLTLRKTCLTICAKQVNHRPDIEALVRLVNLLRRGGGWRADQSKAACALAETLWAVVSDAFQPAPINSVGLLGHWKALVSILSLVGVEVACRLLGDFWKVFEKDLPESVDSHFYMNRLSKKTGLEVTALKKTLEKT